MRDCLVRNKESSKDYKQKQYNKEREKYGAVINPKAEIVYEEWRGRSPGREAIVLHAAENLSS